MPNVSLWGAFQYADNSGGIWGDGNLDIATILSGLTDTAPFQGSVNALAQNSIGTLWLSGQGGAPSDFAFCWIVSDVGDPTNGFVILEETTDVNNLIGKELFTRPLYAGVPYILGGSASYANYTDDFAGGTLSKIQRFRVKNLNSTAANIKIWMIL